MKKTILILTALATAFCATAQRADSKETPLETSIYTMVEKSPEFPGGMEGLMQYLASTIQYPDSARVDGVEGTVYVTFVVEPDGSTSARRVLNSPHESLSQEALRVVREMPRWKAGRQRGKKVRVQYTLPINFQLQ